MPKKFYLKIKKTDSNRNRVNFLFSFILLKNIKLNNFYFLTRMLDENYRDQIEEIVKFSPKGRQTMLFSATMTDEVTRLLGQNLGEVWSTFIGTASI